MRSTRSFLRSSPPKQKHYTRPKGLWVSVVGGRDWPSMNPGDLRSQHQYEITLADDAKIRFIDGRKQLSEFTKKYGLKPSGERRIAIDWVKVATEHQGLIISPYIAEHTRYPPCFGTAPGVAPADVFGIKTPSLRSSSSVRLSHSGGSKKTHPSSDSSGYGRQGH